MFSFSLTLKPVECTQLASLAVWKPVVIHFFASFLGKAPVKNSGFESVLDHFAVNTFPVMESEVSRWLSSISCGFDLKHLAKDFEDRGFTTKASLKKQESFSDEIQFLEARISSAKHEYTRLQQKANEYERAAPKRAKTCSNCHLTGHQKRYCKNPTCPGISQYSLQSKHLEVKSEIAELQTLIKDLEKRSEKAKSEFMNFKAAREKASNSFFAIMRPRLRKSNRIKYAGNDRLLLNRDLMTLKKALNNNIPVGEENDWRLQFIIEEFRRRNIVPFQLTPGILTSQDVLKSTSSRRLAFPQ